MANEKEPEPGTRGWRMDHIRKRAGLKREELAAALAHVAAELQITSGGKWTPSKVSRLILNRKTISLDDAAVVVTFARRKHLADWDWFVLGEPETAHPVKPVTDGALSAKPVAPSQASKKRATK